MSELEIVGKISLGERKKGGFTALVALRKTMSGAQVR